MADTPLRDDLLTGAAAIADELGWPVRKIYHAAANNYLPIGRVGQQLVARRSQLAEALKAPIVNPPAAA